MSVPTEHISDNIAVKNIVNGSGAFLRIKSVVSGLDVRFPAFLTDFSQQFDATWNTEDVFGRMDPIGTYQNTKRTMSLGFDIPAGSSDEAKNNLEKTQNLVKMVYPVYSDIEGSTILSKPPLVRGHFANLIKSEVAGDESTGLLGWISGLSWKPSLEMGMFGDGANLFPKVISMSFSFNILHEQTLSQDKLSKWPFGV